jgi:hypothetical protein
MKFFNLFYHNIAIYFSLDSFRNNTLSRYFTIIILYVRENEPCLRDIQKNDYRGHR